MTEILARNATSDLNMDGYEFKYRPAEDTSVDDQLDLYYRGEPSNAAIQVASNCLFAALYETARENDGCPWFYHSDDVRTLAAAVDDIRGYINQGHVVSHASVKKLQEPYFEAIRAKRQAELDAQVFYSPEEALKMVIDAGCTHGAYIIDGQYLYIRDGKVSSIDIDRILARRKARAEA